MNSGSGGRAKRPREQDEEDENLPAIRIKAMREIKEEVEETEGIDDYWDPPTPPIPRSKELAGVDNDVPTVCVKQEIDIDANPPRGPEDFTDMSHEELKSVGVLVSEPNEENHVPTTSPLRLGPSSKISTEQSGDGGAVGGTKRQRTEEDETRIPIVKTEPLVPRPEDSIAGDVANDEVSASTSSFEGSHSQQPNNNEENWDEEGPSRREANAGDEEVKFFGLPSASSMLKEPNAMTAEFKHPPSNNKSGKAGYYNVDPEQEQQYGTAKTINPIPLFVKTSQSTAGSDDEEEGNSDHEDMVSRPDSAPINLGKTRYFLKKSVYEKYEFEKRAVDPTKLAVYERKAQILSCLERGRVLIIEGFTGCGKTTQVPQYILDKCREERKFCNIVVTQPRKIAAISVARRVCYERGWNLGSIVGYQVGMESKRDRDETLLTFVTTGVLQQQLISKKSLKDYTHIIIDEVHERDLESDFLLLIIKKIMAFDTDGKEQNVKLILMSATINTKQFEDYFPFSTREGDIVRPGIVKIPMMPRFRVEELYLEGIIRNEPDLFNQIDMQLEKEKAIILEDIYEIAVNCIISLDERERESIRDPRLKNKLSEKSFGANRGSVLVFLPGMEEIKRMERTLYAAEKKTCGTLYCWEIVTLHSLITSDDQAKVFEPAKRGNRKIILSTNIAESSVTVPDINYVIDFCLTKSLCIDKTTNFTTLRLIWASKSQCVQRKGRTGRVADGIVFRLIPKRFYDECLDDEIVPEMKRSNLETVILHCKKFELDSPKNLLSEALDKPDLSGIQRATATLKELGALTIEMADRRSPTGTRYDDCDGDLTFVGKVMADLPIPQQCTRLILLGHCFGVMQEAIIIAAGVSVKSPFQAGFRQQLELYLKKMEHAKTSFSDLFSLYNVYKYWDLNYSGGVRRNWNAERNWARAAQVNLSVLREIKSTITLLEDRLKRLGVTETFVLSSNAANPAELTAEQGLFLKIAIAGAFYPRYFIRRRPDLKQYERELQREVNGNDVFRTVYFKGFPNQHNGKLYAKHMANFLSYGLSIPAIKFDGQKVLAIFDNSTGDTIGPINRGIFRAIKLRQLRTETLEFNMLWRDKEAEYEESWNMQVRQRQCTICPPLRSLPPVYVEEVEIRIQHIVSPSQFWVVLKQDFTKLQDLCHDLETASDLLPRNKLYPNSFCLAPFDGCYYRAKILRVIGPIAELAPQALVYFVDYGNSEWVSASVLYDFSRAMVQKGVHKLPCMAIECRLKELKPNIMHGLHWSFESISMMEKFRNKAAILKFKIFSVYQSIMVGELFGYNERGEEGASLNELLSTKQENKLLGESTLEPYFSVDNHLKRERAKIMTAGEAKAIDLEQIGDPLDLDFIEPPDSRHAKTPCRLKGPWSPLEMSFQALVHCSNTKQVRVENSSVNSVLLDHEPTASNSRMLVAAHVGVVERSQSVMVRESSIMPSIPGILSLVCLMFSPKAELRVDCHQTRYTGILCGCGTVPSQSDDNVPVHPDNDMEVVFDTVIDDDDIDEINQIRSRINSILRSGRGVNKAELHKNLRTKILKLFKKARARIDEEIWPQEEYVWNRISSDNYFPVGPGLSFNHDDIFQPHRKIRLNAVEDEEEGWDGAY